MPIKYLLIIDFVNKCNFLLALEFLIVTPKKFWFCIALKNDIKVKVFTKNFLHVQ